MIPEPGVCTWYQYNVSVLDVMTLCYDTVSVLSLGTRCDEWVPLQFASYRVSHECTELEQWHIW